MISLTINFGFGFLAGLLLSLLLLLLATILLLRRIHVHLQTRDLTADRKSIVGIIATMVADILDHPAVVDALSRSVTRGINTWMSSEESYEVFLEMYAKAPRTEAAREIGKEVPGYVKHFGMGVVDAFRGGRDEAAALAEMTAEKTAKLKTGDTKHRKKE